MSGEHPYHAVLLFPQAVESLGAAVAAYLSDGPLGPHIQCKTVNATGSFFEMVFDGKDDKGRPVEIEVMVPHGFIRMVLSVRAEGSFGFRQRPATAQATVEPYEPG